MTIWTAGFGVPDLAATSGLHTDELGRLLTDETLTSVDDPTASSPPATAPRRRACRCGCAAHPPHQLGPQAANTVLSRIAGTTPAEFDYAYRDPASASAGTPGILQFAHKDDTPVNCIHRRTPRRGVKEAICKGTLWGLRREARKPGSTDLVQGWPAPEQPESAPKRSRTRDHRGAGGRLSRQRRTRRAVHPSAAAAVHDRLRDPGQCNRIRRCAAGELPALGQGRPRNGE